MDPTLVVFLAALVTALATGLGALPLLAGRDVPRHVLGLADAAAGGLMLAASFALIDEGLALDPVRVLLGLMVGLAAIVLAKRLIDRQTVPEIAELSGLDAKRALLIIGVMTAHSFAEGIGIGVSFGGTGELSAFITTALAIHNIPEGLAIALVLVPRGTPVWQAALWAIFSSLPQPLMAVPAFLLVSWFAPLLPVGLGIAAGAMIWMVQAELVPDANEKAGPQSSAVAFTLAFAAMLAFQYLVLKP